MLSVFSAASGVASSKARVAKKQVQRQVNASRASTRDAHLKYRAAKAMRCFANRVELTCQSNAKTTDSNGVTDDDIMTDDEIIDTMEKTWPPTKQRQLQRHINTCRGLGIAGKRNAIAQFCADYVDSWINEVEVCKETLDEKKQKLRQWEECEKRVQEFGFPHGTFDEGDETNFTQLCGSVNKCGGTKHVCTYNAYHPGPHSFESVCGTRKCYKTSACMKTENQDEKEDHEELRNEICEICGHDIINYKKNYCYLACGHLFHRKCVQPWLQDNLECPLCRRNVG